MKTVVRIICIAAICALFGIDRAAAQLPATGCTSEPSANATQTLRCRGGIVIVAEEGAKFTLQSQGGSGAANGVDLQDKALLLDAPKQSGKSRLEVTTPQAICRRARHQMGRRCPGEENVGAGPARSGRGSKAGR